MFTEKLTKAHESPGKAVKTLRKSDSANEKLLVEERKGGSQSGRGDM